MKFTKSNTQTAQPLLRANFADARLAVLLILLIAPFISCVNDYNPFAYKDNAAVVIQWQQSNLVENATLNIFSTETLHVAPLVAEQIDSFWLTVEKNRFFRDTIIRSCARQNYLFPLSFTDTGFAAVTLSVARKGSAPVSEQYRFKIVSPLFQSAIQSTLDSMVTLSTPAVADSVRYVWQFGDGITTISDSIESPFPQTQKSFGVTGALPGRLWVAHGLWRSPSVPFAVMLSDNTGPKIVSLNAPGDTIITGSKELLFEVAVSDVGGVREVTINSQLYVPRSDRVYSTVLRSLDTAAQMTTPVNVSALDRSNNLATARFYVVYDSLAPSFGSTRISIDNIKDTAATGRTDYQLLGRVWSLSYQSLTVRASVNGLVGADSRTVMLVDGAGEFDIVVALDSVVNRATVQALDSDGVVLADTVVTILRDGTSVDTAPPVILDMLLGSVIVDEKVVSFVQTDTATLVVRCFDESGVLAVTVNGQAALRNAQKSWAWSAVVQDIPHANRSVTTVQITDSSGLIKQSSFLVQRNRIPRLPASFVWPPRFFAGIESSFELEVYDDGDLVTLSIDSNSVPQSLRVKRMIGLNKWEISITPNLSDIGTWNSRVVLSDPYQRAEYYWAYTILADSSIIVKFRTIADSIPRFLTAVRDTIRINCEVSPGKGSAPFRFIAQFDGTIGKVMDQTVTSRTAALVWTPQPSDTGLHHFSLIVIDSLGDSDTLYRDITILPLANKPCRLHFRFDSTAIDSTTVDLRAVALPYAAQFSIEDPDDPRSEHFWVTTTRGGVVSTFKRDSAGPFTISLGKRVGSYVDTMVVSIVDRAGFRDTVQLEIINRLPPLVGSAEARFALAGVPLVVPLNVYDSAGLSLSARLISSPQGMALAPDESQRLNLVWLPHLADSGLRVATVEFADRGFRTLSLACSVYVEPDPSNRVRFDTSIYTLAPSAVVGTMFLQYLKVNDSAGTAPFEYRLKLDNGDPILESWMPNHNPTIITWTPTAAQAGMRTLIATVRDKRGGCDTLYHRILVGAANTHPCELTRTLPSWAIVTNESVLDLSDALGSAQIRYQIVDQDYPTTDSYLVTIRQGKIITTRSFDTTAFFTVTIDTATRWGLDTVTVSVADAFGVSASDTLVVRFRPPQTIHPAQLLPPYLGTLDTTSAGELDLRAAFEPVTIRYTISDQDPVANERYEVSIVRAGISTVQVLDTGRTFWVTIDPFAARSIDTIVVQVTDLSGSTTADTLIVLNRTGIIGPQAIPSLYASQDASVGVLINDEADQDVLEWQSAVGSPALTLIPPFATPDRIDNALNGFSAVRFEIGELDHLVARTGTSNAVVDWDSKPFTFAFVVRFLELVSGERAVLISSGKDNSFELGITCNRSMAIFNERSNGACWPEGAGTASSDLAVTTNKWYILTYRSQTGIVNSNIAVDVARSGTSGAIAPTMTNALSGDYLVMGAGELGNLNGFLRGDIAEFAYYDRALTDTELDQLTAYLATKYALTLE